MKALSVLQPWASLLAHGAKRFETRWKATAHRGPIAIHASASDRGLAACADPGLARALRHAGIDASALPLGAVLATGVLSRVLPAGEAARRASWQELALGDFSDGRFAWEISGVVLLAAPVPAKGRLWLWPWEPAS